MEYPWNDYTNETLIHLHKKIRTQRKMYQRASDFYNTFYSIFGLINVLTSTVASTLSWGGNGKEMDENKQFILSIITTTSALSAAIQNFYNFKENSNKLIETSKTYSKLQNRLENIGNIHPDYREENPYELFKLIDTELDKITDSEIKPKKVKEFALVISKIISRIKYYKKRAAIYKKKYNKKFEVSETYRSVFVDRN